MILSDADLQLIDEITSQMLGRLKEEIMERAEKLHSQIQGIPTQTTVSEEEELNQIQDEIIHQLIRGLI